LEVEHGGFDVAEALTSPDAMREKGGGGVDLRGDPEHVAGLELAEPAAVVVVIVPPQKLIELLAEAGEGADTLTELYEERVAGASGRCEEPESGLEAKAREELLTALACEALVELLAVEVAGVALPTDEPDQRARIGEAPDLDQVAKPVAVTRADLPATRRTCLAQPRLRGLLAGRSGTRIRAREEAAPRDGDAVSARQAARRLLIRLPCSKPCRSS
jgi:hypothetical protein